jgi:hypothetical protein
MRANHAYQNPHHTTPHTGAFALLRHHCCFNVFGGSANMWVVGFLRAWFLWGRPASTRTKYEYVQAVSDSGQFGEYGRVDLNALSTLKPPLTINGKPSLPGCTVKRVIRRRVHVHAHSIQRRPSSCESTREVFPFFLCVCSLFSSSNKYSAGRPLRPR